MKFLMSLIRTLVLAGLSIAVGLSFYSRFGGNLAEKSIEQDFGRLSFFLSDLLGQLILYVIFLLFVSYITLKSLWAKNSIQPINYEDVLRRTRTLEKRQEAAFQHINQLEASWGALSSQATTEEDPPVWRTVEFNKMFLQIKQELDVILNKIHQQKGGPTSKLLDSIQERLEHLEDQIETWVVQTSISQTNYRKPELFFEDNQEFLAEDEIGPFPSRRDRHKSLLKKLFTSSSVEVQDQSTQQTELKGDFQLDESVSELPSRRETHSPWWKKRRASEPKSNVEK